MSDKTMTKTEARAAVRRAREGLRWIEEALRNGDASELSEACGEVEGAVALIRDAMDDTYGRGISGVSEPGYVPSMDTIAPRCRSCHEIAELDVTGQCEPCALPEPIPTVGAISITSDGRAVRLTCDDTTEGIARVIGANIHDGLEVLIEGGVRIYYDANGATDNRPVNDNAAEIIRRLTGLPLGTWYGPILIAGRPTLDEDDVDVVASVVPSFDYAGRW